VCVQCTAKNIFVFSSNLSPIVRRFGHIASKGQTRGPYPSKTESIWLKLGR